MCLTSCFYYFQPNFTNSLEKQVQEKQDVTFFNKNAAETSSVSVCVPHSVCAPSYPVCVQLCLHGGDIAPYRRLLLQLLTF